MVSHLNKTNKPYLDQRMVQDDVDPARGTLSYAAVDSLVNYNPNRYKNFPTLGLLKGIDQSRYPNRP